MLLTEQASQIAKALGHKKAPADYAYGFQADQEYYRYLSEHRAVLDPWEAVKRAQPAMVRFWYRQSPSALLPYDTQFVTMGDPPNVLPGMVGMRIDTQGRLSYL